MTFPKKAFEILQMTVWLKIPGTDDDRAQNKALCQSEKAIIAVQMSDHFSNNDQNIFMRLTFTAYPYLYFICFISTSLLQLHNFFQESICPASDDSFLKSS